MMDTGVDVEPDFDLSEQSTAIGKVFDDIGENLAACNSGISQVVADAARIGAELGKDKLESTVAGIEPILDHCRALLSDFEQEGLYLADLESVIQATDGPLAGLVSTIKMVSMVSVNARVVSAVIETTEDLGVFTNDLVELIAEMHRVTSRFAILREGLANKVGAESIQLSRFRQVQGKGLRRILATLPAELAQIQRIEADAARIQRDVTANAATMQKSIARAVPLLQVGDATRQRLEHVTLMPSSIDEAVRHSNAVAHIRGELLDAAVVQLQDDVRYVGEELGEIGDTITVIVQQTAGDQIQGWRHDVAKIKDAISDTVASLQECEEGHMRSAALRADTHAALDELADCLADLDDIVRAAGWVSMNAAISCVRLGSQGVPLALVAEQVRGLNDEVTRQSGQIVAIISGGKAKFEHSGACRVDGATAFAEFRQHFICTLDRLEEANEEVNFLRERLAGTGREIHDRLQSVQQHTGGIDGIVEELVGRLACERPRRVVEGHLTPDNFLPARALLTMQDERDTFDRALAECLPQGLAEEPRLIAAA